MLSNLTVKSCFYKVFIMNSARFLDYSIKVLMLLIAVVLIGGCTNSRLSNQEREALIEAYVTDHKLEQTNKITAFRFYGWRELGRNHLIVSTRFNRPYLLTLKSSCLDLQFSQTIGIHNTGSTLDARFDSVFVPSYPHQKCFIRSIHPLTREQADELSAIENGSSTPEKVVEPSNQEGNLDS